MPATRSASPWLSVITVCFNAAGVLPATVASLRAQQAAGVEWVVVDGASRDGSTDWLRAQQPDRFLSEPDSGIYDAMNKALALASGEWLFFLNAGDAFADPATLADVAAALQRAGEEGGAGAPDILWGDVLYVGARGERPRRFHWVTRRRLLFGDLCHQAVFVRRALVARIGNFDASLRYNADFDWLLRAFGAGARLQYLRRDIARFDDGGAHVQAGASSAAERNLVRARHLPLPLWRLGNWALRLELKLRRLAGQTI
jgi:glycosyltransferase involved in cell wall biosynthesis